MNDIFVYLMQFKPGAKGAVVIDEDGDYTIYINSIYNAEQQQEIYRHEMRHILGNHQYIIDGDLEEIELAANDKCTLLAEIKRAEKCGLPLTTAIIKPPKPEQIKPNYKKIVMSHIAKKREEAENYGLAESLLSDEWIG